MKVEEDEYMDIERRETVKAEARKLRKQFLRYKEAEIIFYPRSCEFLFYLIYKQVLFRRCYFIVTDILLY